MRLGALQMRAAVDDRHRHPHQRPATAVTVTATVAAVAALQPAHHLDTKCWPDKPTVVAPTSSCWRLPGRHRRREEGTVNPKKKCTRCEQCETGDCHSCTERSLRLLRCDCQCNAILVPRAQDRRFSDIV